MWLFEELGGGKKPIINYSGVTESAGGIVMGKPLRPKDILFISELPKKRNAKVMRRIIRSAYLGEKPGDISSLVNPEIVEGFRNLKWDRAVTARKLYCSKYLRSI